MNLEYWPYYVFIGIVLVGLEIILTGFFLLPVGVAFLVSAPFSLLISDRPLMHVITAIWVIVSIYVFRKYFKKSDRMQKNPTDDLIGKEIILESDPQNQGRTYGKIYGESWALVPENSRDVFVAGEAARITAIDGNKLIIKKIKE